MCELRLPMMRPLVRTAADTASERGRRKAHGGIALPSRHRPRFAVRASVLKPAVLNAVMAGVKEAMKPATISRETARRERELSTVDQEIARLTEAIATASTPLPTLLEALQARQRRRDDLIGLMESIAPARRQTDVNAIDDQVRSKLAHWRGLLTRHTKDGRQLLREVLQGPIRFTPEGKMYRFNGKAALGRLLAGIASNVCGVPGRI
jgi:hypothetical protein